tara:strand:- start:245 stop:784 length:540 start_codon:yes stop_codon:yes gene_type:complete
LTDSFKNQFLVALPTLSGDYFQNSITLIVDHNADGAFGLMINRPLDQDLRAVFPDLPGHIHCPLLEGGPVERDQIFFLHRGDRNFESTYAISADLSLTTSRDLVDLLHDGDMPEPIVAILGYAGWAANQLETELGENTWLLTPANADIVFEVPAEQRASAAAKQLGVDINLIAPRAGHD